jgi:hypothetical protein
MDRINPAPPREQRHRKTKQERASPDQGRPEKLMVELKNCTS